MKSSPTCTDNWVRAAEFHVPVIRLLAKGHDFGAGFEPQALKARWMDVPYGGRKTGEARPYFAANRRRCKILSSEQPARVLPANLSSTDITVNPHAFGFQTQGFAPPRRPCIQSRPSALKLRYSDPHLQGSNLQRRHVKPPTLCAQQPCGRNT